MSGGSGRTSRTGHDVGLEQAARLVRALKLIAHRKIVPDRTTKASAWKARLRRTHWSGFCGDRTKPKRVADYTYVWIVEGRLFVAAALDLFSGRIVGWSMKAHMTANLVSADMGN